MLKICTIPGDGIGPEVMDACLCVLKRLPFDIKFISAEMGLNPYKQTGEALPKETIKIIKEADSCLFGAITTPADTTNYESPLLRLRKELNLFANVRPIKTISQKIINKNKITNKNLNCIIIRENTEGLYTGLEDEDGDKITTKRIVSKNACERIVKYAFKYASNKNRKKITCVHKANVLRKSDGLFKKIFYDIAKEYNNINTNINADDCYVDTAALLLVTAPEKFDMIVTLNLYGDILSDEAAGLIGGLGFAPSGNIGDKYSIFEPVHGSAPDIAGKNIANPTAMILSSAMMFEHLGSPKIGTLIENAVIETYRNGNITTDLGGRLGTKEFADRVVEIVERESKKLSK
ncbi:MAG: isocitrate/isopropylmalate dehydrogenase family protein [Thermoplasmata archaeon]